jgi:hypothetical protein
MGKYSITFSAVQVPLNSGGISVTLYEDVGDDGSGSNTDPNGKAYNNSYTIQLSDKTTTYLTDDSFDASSGNALWLEFEIGPPSDITTVASVTAPIDVIESSGTPATPSNASASPSDGNIEIQWDDNSTNETEFRIYRATSSGTNIGDYTQIDTVPPDTTMYTDTSVSEATQYYYRVTAYNVNGESPLSNEATATSNTELSGVVNLGGSPVQGAKITIYDDTNNTVFSTVTTDSNGNFTDYLTSGNVYHVLVEYDDGQGNKYNDESKPFIAT